MFKFMKYEIRGTYKFVLATILIVCLATIGIQYSMYSLGMNLPENPADGGLVILLFPLLTIVIMAASIAFVVYLIRSFKRELNEDRGYLTFTLPLAGKKILGAKFLTAIIWYVVFGLIVILTNYLMFNILFTDFVDLIYDRLDFQLRIILSQLGRGVVSGMLIYSIVSSVASLLNVYFSITLSKVAIKNRSIGGFWILIFIGLQIVFNIIENRITNFFPVYTSFGEKGFSSVHNLVTTEFGLTIDVLNGSPVLSVSAIIYWVILSIGLFIATGYLLDRKIEL